MPEESTSVIKDGDLWTAIVDGERFTRFRSEADARDFARTLCSVGDDENDEIEDARAEHIVRHMRMELRGLRDPDERARMQRTIALTQRVYRMAIVDAAIAKARQRKH